MSWEFHRWSHGSIFHHKAAGSSSPQATSDHCRMRLVRNRECSVRILRRRYPLLQQCVPLSGKVQLASCEHWKHAHESSTCPQTAASQLNWTRSPLPTSVWFIPAPLYPQCEVCVCCRQHGAKRLWQSCGVNRWRGQDREIFSCRAASRRGGNGVSSSAAHESSLLFHQHTRFF